MTARIQFTPQAAEDLDTIWQTIADDSRDAADRVETEILAACHRLARHPRIGTKREDITPLAVRFWTVTKFPKRCRCLSTVAASCCGFVPGIWSAKLCTGSAR
jgi:plasmid stabilization system protein ParE